MTPRQQQLLRLIIDRYIRTGEPISSRFLEDIGAFGVKSATLRNEMNNLEQAGYLTQLYTSSGRVPTDRGYRFFVDSLLSEAEEPTSPRLTRQLSDRLEDTVLEPRHLTQALAQALGDLSGVMVIARVDQNRPVDIFKVGLSNLFGFPEFHALERAVGIAELFDHFEDFADSLLADWQAPETFPVCISIGRENRIRNASHETVMSTRYRLPGGYTGTVTMVGPMRMDYRRNVGLLCSAADLMDALAERH